MTGEDLELKPGSTEIKRGEHSPLAQIITRSVKQDDKVNKIVKYSHDLKYDSVYNFDKYSVSNFHEISSVDSQFDRLDNFKKI